MAEDEKYVKLKHVRELIGLIKRRDTYPDWSDKYDTLNKKVNNTIDWIERNAKELYASQ